MPLTSPTRARRTRERRLRAEGFRAVDRFHGCPAPDAFVAAGFLRAGADRRRSDGRGSPRPSRHDRDNFNRWQAAQSLATRILLRGVAAIRAGRAPSATADFCPPSARDRGRAQGASIPRSPRSRWACRARPTSRARSARTSIPTRSSPRAWHCAARSGAHSRRARRAARRVCQFAAFSPDAAARGRRALRNVALAMFVAGDGPGRAHAQRQLATPTT